MTIRSASGVRDSVILDGGLSVGEPIGIAASNVTVADLTIKRAYWHNIHVAGGESDTNNAVIHNVHAVDAWEQQIKVNPNNGHFTDYGELRCSLIEITDEGRPLIADGCYTGGSMPTDRGLDRSPQRFPGHLVPQRPARPRRPLLDRQPGHGGGSQPVLELGQGDRVGA